MKTRVIESDDRHNVPVSLGQNVVGEVRNQVANHLSTALIARSNGIQIAVVGNNKDFNMDKFMHDIEKSRKLGRTTAFVYGSSACDNKTERSRVLAHYKGVMNDKTGEEEWA